MKMRTNIVRVTVEFDTGDIEDYDIAIGYIQTSSTRVRGMDDKEESVDQVTVHFRPVIESINKVTDSSRPPKSIPENDEVANGIDD